uniref:PTS glucose transporter subunit IIA n=1 Tax=Paenibacillus xylanexedens TaxID=528191 RepID=UPI001642D92D
GSVGDEGFWSEGMGKGIGIMAGSGRMVCAVEGVVRRIRRWRDGIGVIGKDGVEVVMDVGVDRVKVKGEGLSVKVEEGDRVNVGD